MRKLAEYFSLFLLSEQHFSRGKVDSEERFVMMKWLLTHWKSLIGILMVPTLIVCILAGSSIQHTIATTHAVGTEQTNSYQDYVVLMAKQHKAPFFSQQLAAETDMQAFVRKTQRGPIKRPVDHSISTNIKVNQDHNAWPKVGVSAAINPVNGKNIVVTSSDFRQNFNHPYYHVTTDGGRTWSDDAVAEGIDSATFAPYNFQSNPGVAFDREGHTFLSNISGNTFSDASTGYFNFDTEIDIVQGNANGISATLVPTAIDYAPCHGVGE